MAVSVMYLSAEPHMLMPSSTDDSGYINGVTGSPVFIQIIEGDGRTALTSSHNSLIVSILSAGTFFVRCPYLCAECRAHLLFTGRASLLFT